MTVFRSTAAALMLFASAVGVQTPNRDPDVAARQGAAPVPAGWQVRLDRPTADRTQISFATMGPGLHVSSGPAAIFWNPSNTHRGAYNAEATFTQMQAPTHPEAYGLIWAAGDLSGDGQNYMYFVIRGDGKFLVRHRAGAETHDVSPWTEHAAIVKQDAAGKQKNTLRVEVTATSTKLYANGQMVKELPRTGMTANTDGIAGIRVNHNLDVHIDGFVIR